MDFLIGVLVTTLVLLMFIIFLINKKNKSEPFFLIKYSQSHIHSILSPLLPQVSQITSSAIKNSQSKKHINNTNVKVLIIGDKAYWTQHNVFYVANVVDGDIDKINAQVVDTMGMDKVELDKMLFIIDQLRKGE